MENNQVQTESAQEEMNTKNTSREDGGCNSLPEGMATRDDWPAKEQWEHV
jgi:hypothetical protein